MKPLSMPKPFAPVPDYALVSELFVRLLGLIYLAAFASLAVQIHGIAGSGGLLPVAELLDEVRERFGYAGVLRAPTLFWLNASDAALIAVSVVGCVFSIVLALGRLRQTSLVVLFVCYLSLFHAGQIFMNFQWDYLLLEAGFLALFLRTGQRWVVWLFRWLLFRLRFLSGTSKLLSGDPAWADLSAVALYFEVQPLPHAGAWYAHQLPDWLLRAGTGATLFIELVVPFMMFLSRGPRFVAAWLTIGLQVLIIATSNHNFSNLLTILLCLFLFDDQALRRVVPARWGAGLAGTLPATTGGTVRNTVSGLVFGSLLALSLILMWEFFLGRRAPAPFGTVAGHARPWHVVHNYHVFPTMKAQRIEVIIEGSLDGIDWKPYEFRYKPGDPQRRPAFIVPHQPRLDWLMWFLPMGDMVDSRWYAALIERLYENAPAVTALLADSPFAERPPAYLRATAWRYRFSDAETRSRTGAWWAREYVGPFPVPAPMWPRPPG